MRLAIVGTGISGLYTAWRLNGRHELTLFESKPYIGGHTHTVDVDEGDRSLPVDTGFIVFNHHNYPNFVAMLEQLGVPHQHSDMSFSFSCRKTGLEYRGGQNLKGLFAQRSNLVRPSFLRMLRDIARFNNCADELVASPANVSLGDFLDRNAFRGPLVEHYLLPMAGAIWSAEPHTILEFPAARFGSFFVNHGLLRVKNRIQWRTVSGGSREYVRKILGALDAEVRKDCPVEWIQRSGDKVLIKSRGTPPEEFDGVVMACHSDQALRLLKDPADAEREVLGAMRYQPNDVVLHTDERLLPKRRRAWAAWNYHRLKNPPEGRVSVTYNLTTLQSLHTAKQYLVTLNTNDAIDPDKIVMRTVYDHPLFDAASMAAQQRRDEISGVRNTWYCGAYWGYGFHEDGVASAVPVAEALGG